MEIVNFWILTINKNSFEGWNGGVLHNIHHKRINKNHTQTLSLWTKHLRAKGI